MITDLQGTILIFKEKNNLERLENKNNNENTTSTVICYWSNLNLIGISSRRLS